MRVPLNPRHTSPSRGSAPLLLPELAGDEFLDGLDGVAGVGAGGDDEQFAAGTGGQDDGCDIRYALHRFTGSGYQLESYTEHITNMLRIYDRNFAGDYAHLEQRLCAQGKIPAEGLTRAIRLAIACHDLAKLDEVSKLKPEYPGWMLERQGAERLNGLS